jgi:hypothetical protein
LDAARDKLIDDITEASFKAPIGRRRAKKFKQGFLLGPIGDGTSISEWGASWEHHAKTRFVFSESLAIRVTSCIDPVFVGL